jgi:hypothetical protein
MTVCFALLFPCLVVFGEADSRAAPEPEVTIEFLRNILRSQLESVHSLSANYTIAQKGTSASSKRPAKDWGPYNYELRYDGSRVSLRTDQNDAAVPPYRYSFDGQIGYDITEYTARPAHIQISSECPRNVDVATRPFDPIGARVRLADLPLPTMMEDPSCGLNGLVQLDGSSCWSVSLKGLDHRAQSGIVVEAWFDPAHDYLPRQITIHREGQSPEEFEWTWCVTTFERVQGNSAVRWFPKTAEFRQQRSVQTMHVTHLELNPRFSDSVFRPKIENGAQVTDIRDLSRVKTYVASDNRTVDKRTREIVEVARKQTVPPDSPLSAAPVQSQAWISALLWGSLACLGIGVYLWRMSR